MSPASYLTAPPRVALSNLAAVPGHGAQETPRDPAVDALLRMAVQPRAEAREASASAQPRIEVAHLHLHANPRLSAARLVVELRDRQPQKPPVSALARDEQPALDSPRD